MKLIKSIWFFLKLGAIAYLVVWLFNRPGTIDIKWQGWVIETSVGFMIGCLLVVLAVTAVLYHWWRRLVSLPKAVQDYRKEQQINKGYQAVTRGLLAVAAGDDLTAHRQAKRAENLLSGRPLTKLLNAQAALMKGDDAQARQHFTSLLEDPEGAFFGVRGLLTRALNNGDTAEALEMARQAYDKEPKRPWVIKILFDLEAQARNWNKARSLITKGMKYDAFTKDEAAQHEAAILLAESMTAFDIGQLDEALKLAQKAQKKAPSFTPAILQTAKLQQENKKKTAAEKTIKTAWKKNPHPDLADFWADIAKDRLPLDQVKWAESLIASNPEHIESRLVLAKAAMTASLWGVARTQLTAALKNAPTKRVYKLLASLEQKEKGDDTQARKWLEKMTKAKPDAQWVCKNSGMTFEEWTPICPADHAFNSLEWRQPIPKSSSASSSLGTVSNQNILPPSVLDAQEFGR